MSNFLGRVERITEWVVISNLENRAVNAACDKAQSWWKDRKQKKHDSNASSVSPTPPPAQPVVSQVNYSSPPVESYQSQQVCYVPPISQQPFPTSMGNNELLITINHVDGLDQWGPLIVIIECNYQRFQAKVGQFQQLSFPVFQFDSDQLYVWIQTEYQQQTVASGNIPIKVLLNNQNIWTPQQQRWIPLRDYYNGPAGQLLVTIEYKVNYPQTSPLSQQQQNPGPPPPYSYYS